MPRKTIDREQLANKETYTKSEVQDILTVYTNCLHDSYGKAMSLLLLSSDGVKRHIKDITEHGNDPMQALDKILDDDMFNDDFITRAESGKAILFAMRAALDFSRGFLEEDLGLIVPEMREIETYIDTNGNQFDNKSEFSRTVREIAIEVMDGSMMGSQNGWDYAVDTSRKGAWITVLTHPKYNEVRLVMVNKNEIDPDSDTLECIQKQFYHITGETNKTIY